MIADFGSENLHLDAIPNFVQLAGNYESVEYSHTKIKR